MPNFAERLKELRTNKKVTQVNMAKFIECTEQHYQRLEYGKVTPNANLLIRLADYYNVSVDYLLGRSDDPKQH